jgi:tetratricopeptide (TPR) repeat protein
MSPSVFFVAVCALLTFVTFANAQSAADTWRDLLVEASYAEDAKDYAKAEQLYTQALHEAERFGAGGTKVATTLMDLGQVYREEKKYAEARAAYDSAYPILATTSGEDSEEVADINFNIAVLMFDQEHQSMALPYLRKALAVYETRHGGEDVKTGDVLCMTGEAYLLEKNFRAAEEPLRRCADVREKDGGMRNAGLAEALHGLALVYQGEGKLDLAEPRFTLAEKIRENTLGITSPLLARTMEDHAILLRQMGRTKEAARLDLIAAAIRRNQKSGTK